MIPHSKPWLTELERQAVNQVLCNNTIANGDVTRQFEDKLSALCDIDYVAAVNSGTIALKIALQALDVGEGDEVILPTYVCKNVLDAVEQNGAQPVLCDIGLDWRMDVDLIAPLISKNTKAIIVVHVFGIVSNVDSIRQFQIPVIEDACQSFGSRSDELNSGCRGDLGVYSFQATKMITTGEGGAIVTANAVLAERVKRLVNGSRLSDLASALGICQLSRFQEISALRRSIRSTYGDALKNNNILLPQISADELLFRFVFRIIGLDFPRLQTQFSSHNIAIRKGVDALLHRQLGLSDNNYPNSCELYNSTVSIPFYPALTQMEVSHIATVTNTLVQ